MGRPLDGSQDPKFCFHRAVHPTQGLHLFIVVQLHHCSTTCSPLASVFQQGAVSSNMTLEALCFHSFFDVLAFLLPLSEGLLNLPPDFVPSWTVVMPVLFCAFLHFGRLDIDSHPTNQYRTVSFCVHLPSKSKKLFGPILPQFSQESWSGFEPCSFLQLFMLVLCCPLLPVD